MDETLHINKRFTVPPYAVSYTAVRSGGPGGQHANKTSSAVQLRCDLNSFHIPHPFRQRILDFNDRRILESGEVLIEVSEQRSQHRNKALAVKRLEELLKRASYRPPKRKRTRPSRSSVRKAIRQQKRRKEIKALRKTPEVPRG